MLKVTFVYLSKSINEQYLIVLSLPAAGRRPRLPQRLLGLDGGFNEVVAIVVLLLKEGQTGLYHFGRHGCRSETVKRLDWEVLRWRELDWAMLPR